MCTREEETAPVDHVEVWTTAQLPTTLLVNLQDMTSLPVNSSNSTLGTPASSVTTSSCSDCRARSDSAGLIVPCGKEPRAKDTSLTTSHSDACSEPEKKSSTNKTKTGTKKEKVGKGND